MYSSVHSQRALWHNLIAIMCTGLFMAMLQVT